MNKQFLISLGIFGILVVATLAVIGYGKGYRFGLGDGKIEFNGTGLLVAKSVPDGAQVLINDKLKTATNNTISLAPGDYDVKIIKEGYFTWEKQIKIQAEVVSKAEALLIPNAPKLESITDIGATDPVIDPNLTKIAFKVASQSGIRNGIYVYDMTHTFLTLQSSAIQVVDDNNDIFSQAKLSWSPDGQDLMATTSAQGYPMTYLLDTDRVNNPPNNVSQTLPSVEANWNSLRKAKAKSISDSLPVNVRKMAAANFNVLSYSPDENKILYQASRSANLPIIIKPRLIGTNSTPEVRNIEQNSYYVYDVKEDRNYKMDSSNFQGAFSWFTDSKHIIFVKNKEVHMAEFDGNNDTIVYAGPFIPDFIFPWPDATKIVILTNLGNSQILPNLYTISLK